MTEAKQHVVEKVATVTEHGRRAGRQFIAGDPGLAARRWLGLLSLALLVLFVADTYLVSTQHVLAFDRPVEQFVQRAPWGPYAYAMDFTNAIAGYWQLVVAVLLVLILLVIERRAGYLMAIAALASGMDQVLKLLLARQRPSQADLVHVLSPSTGYSYPSGHAVFYTWLCFMFVFALAPRIPPRLRPLAWAGAGVVIITACLGRVWAGAHWPSDVLGGFLMALCWSAFVLWLPERFLPSPNLRWLRHSRRLTT